MSLTAGMRLGSYQIVGPLGAGGMGQVYRAHDTKLGRDVAIKSLPAAFSLDPERLARFEREARVMASLNHPNIAAIYGVEEAGDVRALVLELVEGSTLADRIAGVERVLSDPPGSRVHEDPAYASTRPCRSRGRSVTHWMPRTNAGSCIET